MESYTVKCKTPNCKKWFRFIIISAGVPGGKMKEDVICPYCRHTYGEVMTDGYVRTEKIEPQPEKE